MLEKILKEYGVDKVSAKTKIPRKHLIKLQEKDFEGFSKPQAFGFVKILQREYGDDFSELKSELDAWFCEGEECKEEIFIAQKSSDDSKTKKAVVAAVLILLAIGSVLMYQQKSSSKEQISAVESPAKTVESKIESNMTEESSQSAKVEKNEAATESKKGEEANESGGEKAASDVLQSEQKSEEPEPYVPKENPVITPIVKLWFGVIDLETKKRVAETTADPYEIDFKGKKLLITGHGRFEISDSFGNLFKYNDAKKHYFLLDDGMVKEISLAEFKRLNGGRVW